jgi:hypothetical protein
MGLISDRAVRNARRASEARRVEKMDRGLEAVRRGKALPNVDRSPHTCGARCEGYASGCPSTVRGGVCPCRYC